MSEKCDHQNNCQLTLTVFHQTLNKNKYITDNLQKIININIGHLS